MQSTRRGFSAAILLVVAVACGGRNQPTAPSSALPPFELSIEGEYRLTFTASPSCYSLPCGEIWVNVAGNLYDWLADCTAPDHGVEFARYLPS
jgi:hypothetical protein